MNITVGELRADLAASLPQNEARWIVEAACDDKADGEFVTVNEAQHIAAMTRRRAEGEPLQYVLGAWQFRMLDLAVDSRALIPRAETETICERALGVIDEISARRSGEVIVADLGCGSGAIGLAVAFERPLTSVLLTDIDPAALLLATQNIPGIGRAATRVRAFQGSWFEALPNDYRGTLDVVVSNPPYIAHSDEVEDQVRDWEPHRALFASDHGFEHLTTIIAHAPTWLNPNGALVVECGNAQTERCIDMMLARGFEKTEVIVDLARRKRGAIGWITS